MLAVTDPYKVLQVDPDAELEVIRAAYRALALKYHPDVSTGSQDRMAALNHAWGILRDAGARAVFDQARADAKRKREVRQPEVRQPEVRQPEVSYEMRAPMPGKPFGSVLDFGRYAGWSLGQVASCDLEYLEWLARTPVGRSFHREINGLLATHAAAAAATATATAERRPGRFRRN